MLNNVIIAFSGRIGSGKSSVASLVAGRLGMGDPASFGDYVRYLAASLGLDSSARSVLQDVGELLAKYPDRFCAGFLSHYGHVGGDSFVIDGIRHTAILSQLRAMVSPSVIHLVYIEVDDESAEKRLAIRSATESGTGVSHRNSQIPHSTEEQVVGGTLRSAADLVVQNDGSVSAEQAADEIVAFMQGRSGSMSAQAPRRVV